MNGDPFRYIFIIVKSNFVKLEKRVNASIILYWYFNLEY